MCSGGYVRRSVGRLHERSEEVVPVEDDVEVGEEGGLRTSTGLAGGDLVVSFTNTERTGLHRRFGQQRSSPSRLEGDRVRDGGSSVSGSAPSARSRALRHRPES